MTAIRPTRSEDIGLAFVSMARRDGDVLRVYARSRADFTDLWVLTQPITYERELDIYQLAVILDREFPSTLIDFHLVNPVKRDPFELWQVIPVNEATLLYRAD